LAICWHYNYNTSIYCSFFVRRKNRKQLSFTILSNTSLVSIDDKLKGDVSVRFKDEEVSDLKLIVFSVKNTGNIPIVRADYEKELKVGMPYSTQVLSGEAFNIYPLSLSVPYKEIIDTENNEHYYSFEPILLNPGDQFSFKFLAANFSGSIQASVRVVGLSDIKNSNNSYYITTEVYAIKGFTLGLILLLGIFLFIAAPFVIWAESLGNFFSKGTFLIGQIILLLSLIALMLMKFSLRRLARHPKFGVALSETIESIPIMRDGL
jgi:hypothetical protein